MSFNGGFVADWSTVLRVLDLEKRGATFELLDEGRFRVVPTSVVTDDDRAFLRARRDEVRAIVEYYTRIIDAATTDTDRVA